jgi:hypothetical protein
MGNDKFVVKIILRDRVDEKINAGLSAKQLPAVLKRSDFWILFMETMTTVNL